MSFTSAAFLLFVAIVTLVYFVVPKKGQWIILLLASYAFYLMSSPKTFVFVLLTTITTFWGARESGKRTKESTESRKSAKEKKNASAHNADQLWRIGIFEILQSLSE